MHLLCPNLVSGSWILRWTLLCLAVVVSMMGTTVAMLYDYHNSHNNHRPAVVRGHLGNHHRVHLHGPTTVKKDSSWFSSLSSFGVSSTSTTKGNVGDL